MNKLNKEQRKWYELTKKQILWIWDYKFYKIDYYAHDSNIYLAAQKFNQTSKNS